MKRLTLLAMLLLVAAAITPVAAQAPIKIGIPAAIQLQVGRDTQDAARMAVDEINAKGGVLGRKLDIVVADETENPEQGISAVKKLTADEKVDVLIGGYTSGVTLAQLPHISQAKTIYIGIGAASPAITAKVKSDYDNYKYIFRSNPVSSKWLAASLVDWIVNMLKKEKGFEKVAIVGENAKWVQDLVPFLKKGATDGGTNVTLTEFFDVQTSDFSPLFSKVKASGAQFLVVILSHASSDVFVKQWYDAQVPLPIGGIDVKSQDSDFFRRVGGKSVTETIQLLSTRAPLTPKTIPFWDAFVKRYNREPVYTGGGTYDAVHLYAEAVARAKSTEPDKVIAALEKTDFTGVAGRIVFDENHDVKYGPGLLQPIYGQWQEGGKRVVVWPKEKVNGAFVLPPWIKR